MTNSDYLLKATVKKLGEKLNQTFLETIEEATNAAQGVPEIIKKEIEELKDEIIKEAERMENSYESQLNKNEFIHNDNSLKNKAIRKIKEINSQLEIINKKLDN